MMYSAETINAVALSMMFFNKASSLRELYERAGSATAIVENASCLRDILPDFNPAALSIDTAIMQTTIERAKNEIDYLEKHDIQCLTPDMPAYPARMREVCCDYPLALYFRGNANLNSQHILSIVGTRNASVYGRDMVDEICSDLAADFDDLIIVSGLAYGTDINAHRAAIENSLPTIAVLAHGLDTLYPALHRNTASKIILNGGLLTEFTIGTSAMRSNFLRRNRIIAALSQGTLVVESKEHGGALVTAQCANDYNLAVMALPGRATDENSIGCLNLIKSNKAHLVANAQDIINTLNWPQKREKRPALPSIGEIGASPPTWRR